ncbi:MAG: hypothetical protein HXY25_10765, partial [Alphaproteobacteria bacterium]|nr:hypothetical protein [Alphaproteobacteria bacterium]
PALRPAIVPPAERPLPAVTPAGPAPSSVPALMAEGPARSWSAPAPLPPDRPVLRLTPEILTILASLDPLGPGDADDQTADARRRLV